MAYQVPEFNFWDAYRQAYADRRNEAISRDQMALSALGTQAQIQNATFGHLVQMNEGQADRQAQDLLASKDRDFRRGQAIEERKFAAEEAAKGRKHESALKDKDIKARLDELYKQHQYSLTELDKQIQGQTHIAQIQTRTTDTEAEEADRQRATGDALRAINLFKRFIDSGNYRGAGTALPKLWPYIMQGPSKFLAPEANNQLYLLAAQLGGQLLDEGSGELTENTAFRTMFDVANLPFYENPSAFINPLKQWYMLPTSEDQVSTGTIREKDAADTAWRRARAKAQNSE